MLLQEGAEFPIVIKWCEGICTKKFGAVKFNYYIMMMHDDFVHCHSFLWYDKEINLFDRIRKNDDWPDAINFKSGDVFDEKLLLKIKNYGYL